MLYCKQKRQSNCIYIDGDIRRALLNGHNLGTKISLIQKRKPIFTYQDSSYEDIIKKFSNRIRIIPVLNRNGKYIGYLSRSKILPFINIKSRKVLILGLGYVGLTLAMVMSESGYTVKGFDLNKDLIKKLKKKSHLFMKRECKIIWIYTLDIILNL